MLRKLLHLRVVVLLIIPFFSGTIVTAQAGNNKKPLVVTPSELSINVGKTCEFKVKCIEEKNARVEAHSSWSVFPDSLGSFNGYEFTAESAGRGYIVVMYKEYSDTIFTKVTATDEEKHHNDEKGNGNYPKIELEHQTIRLPVGEIAELTPTYWLSRDSSAAVDFSYNVEPAIVGTVSSEGIFTAKYAGNAVITISYQETIARMKVMVTDKDKQHNLEYPLLDIVTSRVNINAGEYVELMAAYYDSSGFRNLITPEWTVHPEHLGYFEDSIFFADSAGKGYLHALFNGLADSIPLHVKETKEYENIWSAYRIQIAPSDTTISVGDSVQFQLKILNKNHRNYVIDSTLVDSLNIEWVLVGNHVGSIDENGLLVTTDKGFAVVKAIINHEKALTTRVIVGNEQANDTTTLNEVVIHRVLPNGNILPSKAVQEGSSFKITGLPFPLNVLNGGLLNFPIGSLHEDVSIYMMLPEQIKEDSTNVMVADSVITGVKFIVMVGDSVVEPYFFDVPLILSLPYKTEILDSLGIAPEEIGVFFSEDGDYTNSGITNVMIDTVENRILANVEHFSSILLRRNIGLQPTITQEAIYQTKFINRPNPFTSSTIFEFELQEEKVVQLIIYNVQGQVVKEFGAQRFAEGKQIIEWNGTNNDGTVLKSGLYFGVYIENGKRIEVNKIIKLGL